MTGPASARPHRAAQIEALLQRHWWQAQVTVLMRLLLPLSLVYGYVARRARQRARPQAGPAVPVLVVGNLVVGGAGKTPAVIALVQAFQAAGRKPGVISRGHGREGGCDSQDLHAVATGAPPQAVGDEPLLIQRRTGVPVWVGRDRSAAARALCAAHPEVDVLLSDDGLQHHSLRRDAELLVFDDRGVGNGLLLPAGPLREALPRQVGRQQRVLYTGQHVSTALPGALGQRRLDLAWPLAGWLRGDPSTAVALHQLAGRRLLAVAGLAAPQKFFGMLRAAGLAVDTLPLPDHHPYATLPWPAQTPDVLTTEKDAVKIDPSALQGTRVWVLPLDFQLPPGLADELLTLLPAPQPKSPMP